jgi:hypothetical protein
MHQFYNLFKYFDLGNNLHPLMLSGSKKIRALRERSDPNPSQLALGPAMSCLVPGEMKM